MDVNATLIAQMVTFAIFVAFTMKFVWPPISRALEKRREQIASGLAAAEQGQKELELAHYKSKQQLTEAKAQASTIIEQAHHRANRIIEEAKSQARVEGERLLSLAQENITQEYQSVKDGLIKEISTLAIAGAEKIIRHHMDKTENERLIAELMDEI